MTLYHQVQSRWGRRGFSPALSVHPALEGCPVGFGPLIGLRKHAGPCFVCPAHFTGGKSETWSIEKACPAAELLRAEPEFGPHRLSEPRPGAPCLHVCPCAKKEDDPQSEDVDPCMSPGFCMDGLFVSALGKRLTSEPHPAQGMYFSLCPHFF